MKELSKKQEELLSFIRKKSEDDGIAPSYEEIGKAFSYSPSAAYYAVEALIKKGYLTKKSGMSRAIVLSEDERNERENIAIPLYEREIHPDGDSPIGTTFVQKGLSSSELYAFRVTSESMKEAGIIPGDIAIMTKDTSHLKNDDIVLADASGNNERMELRRYRKLPDYVLLIPDNEIMGERKSANVTVHGILLAIRREYR